MSGPKSLDEVWTGRAAARSGGSLLCVGAACLGLLGLGRGRCRLGRVGRTHCAPRLGRTFVRDIAEGSLVGVLRGLFAPLLLGSLFLVLLPVSRDVIGILREGGAGQQREHRSGENNAHRSLPRSAQG